MLAPWLQPTDVIGAMSRGAQLGLSARSEDEAEANAADRLQLAYNQMASEERRSSELQKYRQDQAAQALLLKKQESEMLNAYRQGELKTREAAQALQAQHFDELKRHNMAMEGKPRYHNVGGVGLVQENPDGTVETVVPSSKEETERQKESSSLAAARLFAGDPNSPGYNVATNVGANILGKYGMMPKSAPTPPQEPSAMGNLIRNVAPAFGGLVGLGAAARSLFKGGNVPRGTTSFEPAPSKEKREKGKTYMTPKGPFTWAGDHWEAYNAGTD